MKLSGSGTSFTHCRFNLLGYHTNTHIGDSTCVNRTTGNEQLAGRLSNGHTNGPRRRPPKPVPLHSTSLNNETDSSQPVVGAIYHDIIVGGKSKTSSNDSGLLLQVDGAVFSGDCNYKYWPYDFPSEKKCIHFVIPHHCGRVCDEKTAKRKLDTVNFSEKANAYACIGKNIYGHPNAKHEELLSSYFHRIIFTDDLKIPEKIGQHIMFNTNTEKYSIVPKM